MYWYNINEKTAASFAADLPFPPAEPGTPELFLVRGDPALHPAAWRVTDPRQLTAEHPAAAWLDPRRMGEAPALPESVSAAAAAGSKPGSPRTRNSSGVPGSAVS